MYVSIKYCLNLTVSSVYVKSEKIVLRTWSWTLRFTLFVKWRSDCSLVDCLYICWIFVVDCVFWSGRQKAYGCYPFQKVVRHIFIHVNIIFYIWIVGLFNELQYNAMYFYIVSSFLFKDRDYFISCSGKCCASEAPLWQNFTPHSPELYSINCCTSYGSISCFYFLFLFMLCSSENGECPCYYYVLFWHIIL